MYCPRCSQEQQKENIKFCSRCGFLMTGIKEVVESGGLPKAIIEQHDPHAVSPKKAGLKQGGILFLSGFVLVPLIVMFTIIIDAEPFAVVTAMILTFVAGVVRMIYALLFESGIPVLEQAGIIDNIKSSLLGKKDQQKALPPQQTEPIPTDFQTPAGHWRETADLQPTSITENTTKTLKDKTFQ